MAFTRRPFLQILLLLSIGMRAIVGAPCCVMLFEADGEHHAHHAHHDTSTSDNQGSEPREDGLVDASANPCCSACSPPLPSQGFEISARTAPKTVPQPTPVRALATRPPYPAYEATGPPTLI